MPQQARIPGKLDAYQVLYMEDGGPKRCDRCVFWDDQKICRLIDPSVKVTADMVCCLYVRGEPNALTEQLSELDPDSVGLGMGDTSCGNCRYGDGSPTCEHPALTGFKIDNIGGCCNAWTARQGESTKDLKK